MASSEMVVLSATGRMGREPLAVLARDMIGFAPDPGPVGTAPHVYHASVLLSCVLITLGWVLK